MVHASKMMNSAIDTARDSMRSAGNVASHRLHDFSAATSDKLHHMGEMATDYAPSRPAKGP